MSYCKDVINYYFKNFLYLFVFIIIPAIFIGALLSPCSLYEFVFNYPNLTLESFSDFFNVLYGLNWLDVLWCFIAFILLTVGLAWMFGAVERHFRTGSLSVRPSGTILNGSVISIAKAVILLVILYFIVNILSLLFMFFIHFLVTINGIPNLWSIVANYIIALLVTFAMARLTTVFGVVALEMSNRGSPLLVAISNTTQAISRKPLQVLFAELVPFVVIIIFTVIGVATGFNVLADIFSMLFFIPYISILAMTIFFDYYSMKKYNNRKYYDVR